MENQENAESSVNNIDQIIDCCGQTEFLQFTEKYPDRNIEAVEKLGQGAFGEAYLLSFTTGDKRALKLINFGEPSKLDINRISIAIPEIKIAKEVTLIKAGFCKTRRIFCLKGRLSEKIRGARGNEEEPNDEKVYLAFEMENAGIQLAQYAFKNASEAYSVFWQVAFSLAIAEQWGNFEHRDLHLGNILIKQVHREKKVQYKFGKRYKTLNTMGVEATIIDFSYARMQVDGVDYYTNLNMISDDIYNDDYPTTYKLMYSFTGNNWSDFEPYTNVLWLQNLINKLITVQYAREHTRTHQNFMCALHDIKSNVLNHTSANKFVNAYYNNV